MAGYQGGTMSAGTPTTGVNGTVTVDNYGDITASAGYGIQAYNYGVGNVTVSNAGATVSGPVGIYTLTAEATDDTSITNLARSSATARRQIQWWILCRAAAARR